MDETEKQRWREVVRVRGDGLRVTMFACPTCGILSIVPLEHDCERYAPRCGVLAVACNGCRCVLQNDHSGKHQTVHDTHYGLCRVSP